MEELKENNMKLYILMEQHRGLPNIPHGIFSSQEKLWEYYQSVKDIAEKIGTEYRVINMELDSLLNSGNTERVTNPADSHG